MTVCGARDISKCRRRVPVMEIHTGHNPTEQSGSLHLPYTHCHCREAEVRGVGSRRGGFLDQ